MNIIIINLYIVCRFIFIVSYIIFISFQTIPSNIKVLIFELLPILGWGPLYTTNHREHFANIQLM